jgi:hypothetical protein
MAFTDITQKLTTILKRSYPQFVDEEHDVFVMFMELYFEFLQQDGGAYAAVRKIRDLRSIDETLDDFIKFFANEYLSEIPDYVLADKRLLAKHIKDLYTRKGNQTAYRLLFRVLFNKDLSFYYPGDDILRASDGKFYIQRSIRTTSTSSDWGLMASRRVVGAVSGAEGTVEVPLRFFFHGQVVTELILTNIIGEFVSGEAVVVYDAEGNVIFQETIHDVHVSFDVIEGGQGYSVDDSIFLVDEGDSNQPIFAWAKVDAVDENGAIRRVRMIEFGIVGPVEPKFVVVSGGTGAVFEAQTGTNITYSGRFLNTDGFLSSDKKLQDNFFYQDFSYVLRAEVQVEEYRDVLRNTVHPAGLLLFGEFFSQRISQLDLRFDVTRYIFLRIVREASLKVKDFRYITITIIRLLMLEMEWRDTLVRIKLPIKYLSFYPSTFYLTFDEVHVIRLQWIPVGYYADVPVGAVIEDYDHHPIPNRAVLEPRFAYWNKRVFTSTINVTTA